MSTTTFLAAQDRVLGVLGTSRSTDRTRVKNYINETARDVWRSHPWWERKVKAFVSCVAPYTTGTVSTTKSSATVTGSGTVFPAAAATQPYKFASGYNEPWYEVSARGGNTSLTLDRVWATTALSASTYVLYDDRVTLATDVDVLLTDEVVLFHGGEGKMGRLSEYDEAEYPWPTGSGIPTWFMVIEPTSTGRKRLRLGPDVPDDIYAIRYGYLKTYTRLSQDGQTFPHAEELVDVIVEGALARSYREEPWADTEACNKAEMRYRAMLAEEIARQKKVSSETYYISKFDDFQGETGIPITLPVS